MRMVQEQWLLQSMLINVTRGEGWDAAVFVVDVRPRRGGSGMHGPGQAACDLSLDPTGGGIGREGAGGVDAGRDGSGLPTRAALIRAWIQMGLL